jgi:hypothetical protein
MKKFLFLAGALLLASVSFGGERYRNSKDVTNTFAVLPEGTLQERADDVNMTGGAATFNEAMYVYYTDVAAPTNGELGTLHFWDRDANGVPLNLLGSAGPFSLRCGVDGFAQGVRVLIPNVAVPASFCFGMKPGGTLDGFAGNRAGTALCGSATGGELGGTSEDKYYRQQVTNGAWETLNGIAARPYRDLAIALNEGAMTSTPYSALNVYDENNAFFTAPDPDIEWADACYLQGTNRQCNRVSVIIVSDFSTAATMDVNIYAQGPSGQPSGAALFTQNGVTLTPDALVGYQYDIAVPNVTLPDKVCVGITIHGLSQLAGDEAGPFIGAICTSGIQTVDFWINDGTGTETPWGGYWFGDPTPDPTIAASFTVEIGATAGQTTINATDYSIQFGLEEGGHDVNKIRTSNDVYATVRNGPVPLPTFSPITIDVTFDGVPGGLTSMTIKEEQHVSIGGLKLRLQMRNNNGNYDEVYNANATTTDSVVNQNVPNPNNYVNAGQSKLKIRVNFPGPALSNTWRDFVDLAQLLVQ